ncbi:MAG: GNAT family N-acetyltransferase [Thermoleophilia bacterium]
MEARLRELAEEPGVWSPIDPVGDLIVDDGLWIVVRGRAATIERIRLAEGRVGDAVRRVRAMAADNGWNPVLWWAGERATPRDLARRLGDLGLRPDDEVPELVSLAIDREPSGASAVEVRRVRDLDAYRRAVDLDMEIWGTPPERRAAIARCARERWEAYGGNPAIEHYVAYLDGAPAGFGRAVFTPWAALLMGGTVRAEARGRGVYRALVHARWRDAVSRGTPRLTTAAGEMSSPVLRAMGFREIGRVRLMRDPRIRTGPPGAALTG